MQSDADEPLDNLIGAGIGPARRDNGNREGESAVSEDVSSKPGRLILVSNRLPMTIVHDERGIRTQRASGGLAAALLSGHSGGESLWVGWPGQLPERPDDRRAVLRSLRAQRLVPVSLEPATAEAFYEGFSNATLWPLFHYFVERMLLDRRWWDAYREANHAFARTVARTWRPGDRIWVHDYHLMLLPQLLRQRLPDAHIGFFLHVPFPPAELFRVLPWRAELIRGVLGADLVGFQVHDDVRHFKRAATRILGVDGTGDHLSVGDHVARLDAFPVGVDLDLIAGTATSDPEWLREQELLKEDLGGRRLILGVDRMDYTKGLPQRLEAYERFLEESPRHHGRVELIQIGIPTRIGVGEYQELRRQVEETVGRINGRFGTGRWTPVKYLYRPVSFARLCALYREASVMLVTPLRDGMNLVAKEYVASKRDGGDGVLVLSEFAGAAAELVGALQVNPYDVDSIAAAIRRGLTMPQVERDARMRDLLGQVAARDVNTWRESFIRALDAPPITELSAPPRLAGTDRRALLDAWRTASGRVLLLDYDGTLRKIALRPELARPDRTLILLLRALAATPGVEVAVVSGRDRQTLERWLGQLPIGLIAEHGRWLRGADGRWSDLLGGRDPGWLPQIGAMLRDVAIATPGSFVERKSGSVAWHWRGVNPELADNRARELLERLAGLHLDPPLEVVQGKSVIEVRVFGVSKAAAATALLAQRPPADLLFAVGDDQTDEQLFGQLPPSAWTVHVGTGPSRARFSLPDPDAVRALLHEMMAATPAPDEIVARPEPEPETSRELAAT